MRQEHRERGVKLFSIYKGWAQDAKLNSVNFTARMLFLRMVDASKNGRVTLEQVSESSDGLRNPGRYMDSLTRAKLIEWDSAAAEYVIVDRAKWIFKEREWPMDLPPERALRARDPRTDERTEPRTDPSQIIPAQSGPSRAGAAPPAAPGARTQPRASFVPRSPSGPDRGPNDVRTAQARFSGRAAQIAEIRAPWDPPDGDKLPAPNSRAEIDTAIAKAQANSPNSTGKSISLSKYPKDRETEAFPSVNLFGMEPK
jgi:hypothetical protein